MPPKARISREMITGAAVEAVRRGGTDSITARTVAGILGCSTQPVMYHFPTVEELRKEAYARADVMHTEYLLRTVPDRDPLLCIGLNYIRFADEEPSIFRFLFQSEYSEKRDLEGLLSSGELRPVLSAVEKGLGEAGDRAKEIFLTLAMTVHGFASLVANGMLEYDEKNAEALLERTFEAALDASAEEDKNESDNP